MCHDHNFIVGLSELQETILRILEDAGIDTETNDKIMELIDDAEIRKTALWIGYYG